MPDAVLDLIRRQRGVETHHPLRAFTGDMQEAIADALMEGAAFRLEPVAGAMAFRQHLAEPPEALLHAEVEEHRQIRPAAADRQLIEASDHRQVQMTGESLVGDRRVRKTVAENDFALRQRGLDQFAHQLGAAGGKQQ